MGCAVQGELQGAGPVARVHDHEVFLVVVVHGVGGEMGGGK